MRSAASRALTGPLPSAAVCRISPSTSTLTVASASSSRPGSLLDEAGVVDDPERRDVARLVAPDEQLEARLGALERQPSASSCLMSFDSSRGSTTPSSWWPSCSARISVFALPPSSRHDEAADVADRRRVDVLVAPLDLGDRRAVDAALVGERRPADVRLVVVGLRVGDLGDRSRQLRQAGEVAAAGRARARAAS